MCSLALEMLTKLSLLCIANWTDFDADARARKLSKDKYDCWAVLD